MTLAHLIAYAWLATILVAIAAAGYKGLPIANVLAPIRSLQGFYFSLATLGLAGVLIAVQLAGYLDLLGQRPITWGGVARLGIFVGDRRLPTPQSMKTILPTIAAASCTELPGRCPPAC